MVYDRPTVLSSLRFISNHRLRCQYENYFFSCLPISAVRYDEPGILDRRIIVKNSPLFVHHLQINLKSSQNLAKKLMQVSTKRKQIEVLNVVEIKYLIPRFNRGTNRPWWKTDRCELTHEGLDVVEVVDKAIIAKQPEPYLQSRLTMAFAGNLRKNYCHLRL